MIILPGVKANRPANLVIVAAMEVHRYLGADYLEDDYEFRSIPMEN